MNVPSIHTWEDCPIDELYPLAVAGAKNQHATCIDFKPPQAFVDFAKSIIEDELGYEVDHWRYWASDLEPVDESRDWQLKFPHTHQWDGRTLVLYLNEPEGGGELMVLNEDMSEHTRFDVRPGMAAVMSDHAIHGVRRIEGSTNRVTMIAGAYPYPVGEKRCKCERTFPVVTT